MEGYDTQRFLNYLCVVVMFKCRKGAESVILDFWVLSEYVRKFLGQYPRYKARWC